MGNRTLHAINFIDIDIKFFYFETHGDAETSTEGWSTHLLTNLCNCFSPTYANLSPHLLQVRLVLYTVTMHIKFIPQLFNCHTYSSNSLPYAISPSTPKSISPYPITITHQLTYRSPTTASPSPPTSHRQSAVNQNPCLCSAFFVVLKAGVAATTTLCIYSYYTTRLTTLYTCFYDYSPPVTPACK